MTQPRYSFRKLPHLLDIDSEFSKLVNTIVPELRTGITRLQAGKELVNEDDIHPNLMMVRWSIKKLD